MAAARGGQVGIGLAMGDPLDRDAEAVREDLRQHGLVARARGLGADRQRDGAVRGEAQVHALEALAAGESQVEGDADPEPPLPALSVAAHRRRAAGEAVPVREIQGQVEHGREVAGVDLDADRGPVRHLVRPDQVAPAQLGRIDAELPGGQVDGALDLVAGFRAPGAAVDLGRAGVGEHRAGAEIDRRDAVGAALGANGPAGRRERPDRGDIGADVADGVDLEGEKTAVPVQGQLDPAFLGPAVAVGQERLAAPAQPLDRPVQPSGREQDQRVFRIERVLHAEAAAHVVGQVADLLARHPEDLVGQIVAVGVDVLRRGDQREGAVRPIVAADRAACLQRHRGDPVVDQIERDDARRAREGGLDGGGVAGLEIDAEVARHVVPDQRRARLQRLGGIGHGGQGVVIDLDQLGRVPGRLQGLGDDEGDRLADEMDRPVGQGRARRHRDRRAVAVLGRGARRDDAQSLGVPLGRGEHGQHPRRRRGRSGIDPLDARVRVGRAQDQAMGHAIQRHVVQVAPRAGQKADVFLALDRLADGRSRPLTHPGSCPPKPRRRSRSLAAPRPLGPRLF